MRSLEARKIHLNRVFSPLLVLDVGKLDIGPQTVNVSSCHVGNFSSNVGNQVILHDPVDQGAQGVFLL